MKLTRRNRNRVTPATPAGAQTVTSEQLPATSTKAMVAAVVTMLGLVGITVTTGTAQVIVMVAQLVLVVYGVWRARNHVKPGKGTGVGGFL